MGVARAHYFARDAIIRRKGKSVDAAVTSVMRQTRKFIHVGAICKNWAKLRIAFTDAGGRAGVAGSRVDGLPCRPAVDEKFLIVDV